MAATASLIHPFVTQSLPLGWEESQGGIRT